MGFARGLEVGILIVLVLTLSGIVYASKDLKKIEVKEVEVEGVRNVSTQGFMMHGTVEMYNPSHLSIPVKNIDYYVIINQTGEVVSAGSLGEFLLARKSSTSIPLDVPIYWLSASKLAIMTLTQEKVVLIIKGYVQLNVPKLDLVTLPFETSVDVKPYLEPYVRQNIVATLAGSIEKTLDVIPPSISDQLSPTLREEILRYLLEILS